ncbi:peptide chain release factor N(5)-glutamine methyltransferase [Neptuniibacter caesariensis]|uniref:Release factor glutamine methyltransferase n=1 Tax=Neptuniibacter caesariensis TaxID=207954 RepID=A0A7U8GRC6_NEPCE|nr:peptide chain release factor N(5)-glutamine methyltransferase [Neptuniibacter caesariensis]EAR60103.1 Methylase of polypeptide chain release factor [Oceanospirillum sp. MED92] [Neptuniibacter caesariensis]
MQIKQALQLSEKLAAISDSPQLDMQYLLCHVLDKPESYLFTWPERELQPGEQESLEQLLQRRLKGEPVAHIIGKRGFWSFELEVSPHTLIPRPDTEVLVEKALELCSLPAARVVDLGTGTGAVALALAKENPGWEVFASDYVKEAAELAERNRQRLHITNMQVLQGSWYEPHSGRFDMIVSNPPYIDPEDPHLDQGDVRFEPLSALTAENQGMADIELIAKQGRNFLNKNGVLAFEHGFDQGPICRNLLQTLGYLEVGTQRDYGQNERVTYGVWPHDGYAEES